MCAHEVAVEIGGLPILLRTQDADFRALLEKRYAGFVRAALGPSFALEVDVVRPERGLSTLEELRVWSEKGLWRLERGFSPMMLR